MDKPVRAEKFQWQKRISHAPEEPKEKRTEPEGGFDASLQFLYLSSGRRSFDRRLGRKKT
jgi:hypothetical protein